MNFSQVWFFERGSLLYLISGWFIFRRNKAFSNNGDKHILDDINEENNKAIEVNLGQHKINKM